MIVANQRTIRESQNKGNAINVLIVDDSAFARLVISRELVGIVRGQDPGSQI